MRSPRWMVQILAEEAGAVEAHQIRQAIQATTAPHMKKTDRTALLGRLDRLANGPPPPTPEIPKERYDPEAAAAYFAARGVKTV